MRVCNNVVKLSRSSQGEKNDKQASDELNLDMFGSPTRARTWDLRINSPSLYQLSYRGFETPASGVAGEIGRRVF